MALLVHMPSLLLLCSKTLALRGRTIKIYINTNYSIVGTPSRKQQAERAKVHHTFNDGDFTRFAEMHKHITIAQASLSDPRTCPQLIDSTIQQCLIHSRPVYIQLPADMVSVPVNAANLQHKIELPAPVTSKEETAAIKAITNLMYSSKRPMILVDGETRAYGSLTELNRLINTTQWPTFITIFAKSCVDEDLPNFRGIWKGSAATPEEKEFVKSRDLILCFGPHFSNTNSYAYSSIPDPSISIMFNADTVTAGGVVYRDLPCTQLLSRLNNTLDTTKLNNSSGDTSLTNGTNASLPSAPPSLPSNGLLTQDHFYKTFSQYLRPGDIILAETGTAGHGCRDFKLPSNTFLFKPTTWLSIGYMLPATQGAGLAQRELHATKKWDTHGRVPRTVLLIGDGSFQMTVQELGTIIREKLNVLLILINNDGYTIERCLHGYKQHYNDIAQWDYLKAPTFFGAKSKSEAGGKGYYYETHQARTWGELEEVMKDNDDEEGPKLKMVEVFMDKEDAPSTLLNMLNMQKEAAAVK